VGQRDRLFHVPGTWNTSRCIGVGCDALWLDPAPLVDDLGLAYVDYYTHHAASASTRAGLAKRAWHGLRRGYLAARHGYYGAGQVPAWHAALGRALYLLPLRRAAVDEEIRELPAQSGGRLLDVGCGSGDWLLSMQGLGWRVQGVDFDARAVQEARSRGLEIGLGSLEEQAYPDAAFDAVTLNHVVEHLPDALATLRECRRLLRPGGTLVLYTPNGASFGHAVFRAHWRGLEPPRHLQLFGPRSLGALLHDAGFADRRVGTVGSAFYWRHSLALWRRDGAAQACDPRWMRVAARVLAVAAHALGTLDKGRGESLVAHATRP
jgi:SAM-dependent methyltransferase